MALTTGDLIARITAHLAATLPTSPDNARWTPSRFLPPSLGQDTEAKTQRCWSVWSPAAAPVVATQRQTSTEGIHVTSTIEAGFCYSLRQDGTAADFAAALAAEDTFRIALFGTARTTLPRFTMQSVSRSLQPDGRTLVILYTLQASHTVPLAA